MTVVGVQLLVALDSEVSSCLSVTVQVLQSLLKTEVRSCLFCDHVGVSHLSENSEASSCLSVNCAGVAELAED